MAGTVGTGRNFAKDYFWGSGGFTPPLSAMRVGGMNPTLLREGRAFTPAASAPRLKMGFSPWRRSGTDMATTLPFGYPFSIEEGSSGGLGFRA